MSWLQRVLHRQPAVSTAGESTPPNTSESTASPVGVRDVLDLDPSTATRSMQTQLGKTTNVTNTSVPSGQRGVSMVEVRAGQISSGTLKRPIEADFPTREEFDRAFLGYQDQRMAELASKHADAFVPSGAMVLYHGSNIPPDVAFKTGLPMKQGDNFDLLNHQLDRSEFGKPETGSALRGTCMDARVPAGMAGEGGYVYALEPRGGAINLSTALMHQDKVPAEVELAMGARQPGCQIKGCYEVGGYSDLFGSFRLGAFVENPDFKPYRPDAS